MAAAVSAEPYDRCDRGAVTMVVVVALVVREDARMALILNDSDTDDLTSTAWDELVTLDLSVIFSACRLVSWRPVLQFSDECFSFAPHVYCACVAHGILQLATPSARLLARVGQCSSVLLSINTSRSSVDIWTLVSAKRYVSAVADAETLYELSTLLLLL